MLGIPACLRMWFEKSHATQTPPPEVLEDLIALARREAVLLVKTDSDETPGVRGRWSGGKAAIDKLFWIDADPDLGFGGKPFGFFIDDEDLAARRCDKAYAYTWNS